MKQDPIEKFKTWWGKAKKNSSLNVPNAVCLSTIDQNGFPSARFVDLKGIQDRCFVFCASLDSKKAREISTNPKVAFTIWWDHVGLQVRITGTANVMSDGDAELHWQNRSREAQIASICSSQSEKLDKIQELEDKINRFKDNVSAETSLTKPDNWGCFAIRPIQIEFLRFNKTRLHQRELYEMKNGKWETSLLQP